LGSCLVTNILGEVEAMLGRRHMAVDLSRLRKLEQRRREAVRQADLLKQERNQASEKVAQLKRGPERDSPEVAWAGASARTTTSAATWWTTRWRARAA
jgi:seryl-tRNA synthetase